MNEPRFIGHSLSVFSLIKTAVIIIVIVSAVIVFLGVPLPVSGNSMVPNFQNGEIVVVEKISYFGAGEVQRGDVVAARFPADPKKTRLIKRVIGLPGELVEYQNSVFTINGAPLEERYQITGGTPPYTEIARIELKPDEYFLVGDNRPGSSDSRLWGPVQRQDIQGRAAFVLFPISQIRYVDRFR